MTAAPSGSGSAAERMSQPEDLSQAEGGVVVRRRITSARPVAVDCAWCRQVVTVAPRGRIPIWCGTACRHRAWEQNRAAASGLAGREVVERVVERVVTLTVRLPVPLPTRNEPSEVRLPTRADDWVRALDDLVRQIETGRIYSRDMVSVGAALQRATVATAKQAHYRHR
jgi:hypothetical protein